jgi:cobalamin biosynthesis Mg chelatase CobN
MSENDLVIDPEDLENVSEEEYERLEELVDEYMEMLERHDDERSEILEKINNSEVYEELGIQVHVSTEYMYSAGER